MNESIINELQQLCRAEQHESSTAESHHRHCLTWWLTESYPCLVWSLTLFDSSWQQVQPGVPQNIDIKSRELCGRETFKLKNSAEQHRPCISHRGSDQRWGGSLVSLQLWPATASKAQTAETISEHFEAICGKYNIKDRSDYIISDSAANMRKAGIIISMTQNPGMTSPWNISK